VDIRTVRMSHDFDDLRLAARSYLAVQSFTKINTSTDELPSPTLVANAVVPEVLAGKWRIRIRAVADETSSGMRVHCQQERDEQMVRVPESLVALLPDLGVRGREHEQHAQKHDVAGDTAGLHVVNLHSGFSSNERAFHVEEVDIVRGDVHDGPEKHGVGNLAMEPLALVQRQPSDLGPYISEQISAHG
jgi:hypothetical protein